MLKFAAVLFALAGLLLAVASAESGDTAVGTVKVRILGPDGKPVAHAEAEIGPVRFDSIQGQPLPHASVKTDADGIATFPWPAGAVQLAVDVAGHGYGNTGIVAIYPGKTAVAALPPLAPMATIAGSVAFVGPHTKVRLGTLVLPVDKTGHFSAEVRAGTYWITANTPGVNPTESAGSVTVSPGDVVRNLKFYPPTTQPAGVAPEWDEGQLQRTDKPFVWVRGSVRDRALRPIAGAKVFATAEWFGGIREARETLEAVTDAAGHYQIEGHADWAGAVGRVVAHAPGMPAEVAWTMLSVPHARDAALPTSPPTVDLVVAPAGGKLDVLAVLDGKPLAGAVVRLQREGGSRGDYDIDDGGEPEGQEMEKIESPTATTGADGYAHFDALPPGRFQVTAAEDRDTAESLRFGYDPDPDLMEVLKPFAIADGVAVRVGQVAVQKMTLGNQQIFKKVIFHLTQPDGRPLVGKASERYGDSVQNSRDVEFNAAGERTETFTTLGMQRVEFRYADPPIHAGAVFDPCYSVPIWVAVTPRMPGETPIDATPVWRGPAALSVQLEDVAGKPAPGIVEIDAPAVGNVAMIGSTDERGNVRFEDVPPGNYVLRARLLGQRGPNLAVYEPASFPADADLIGQTFVPFQAIALPANSDQKAVLQSRPAGYVRGVLHPPAGHSPGEYRVYWDQRYLDQGAEIAWQSVTGRFVLGPFAPGKINLYSAQATYGEIGRHSQQQVTVQQDRVAVADVIAPPAGLPHAPPAADLFTGHVYQSDGKTPAYGATVQFFVPRDWQPHIAAITDITGAFHGHFLEYMGHPGTIPPGGPADSVAVAMVPGTCGATIVDLPAGPTKPLSIILPPPITWHGTLTLGGKNLTGQPGQFRVLAEYQGIGNLTKALSVWATPQCDGSFELAGLTPGTYRVQAALDGIWLSGGVTLEASGKPQGEIRLDIAMPGGPAVVHCVSAKGKPLCGVGVIVDRPAGPLADLYWPKQFTTDGAGNAWIPALESGEHTARLPGNPAAVNFTVPPLPSTVPVKAKLQMR